MSIIAVALAVTTYSIMRFGSQQDNTGPPPAETETPPEETDSVRPVLECYGPSSLVLLRNRADLIVDGAYREFSSATKDRDRAEVFREGASWILVLQVELDQVTETEDHLELGRALLEEGLEAEREGLLEYAASLDGGGDGAFAVSRLRDGKALLEKASTFIDTQC